MLDGPLPEVGDPLEVGKAPEVELALEKGMPLAPVGFSDVTLDACHLMGITMGDAEATDARTARRSDFGMAMMVLRAVDSGGLQALG